MLSVSQKSKNTVGKPKLTSQSLALLASGKVWEKQKLWRHCSHSVSDWKLIFFRSYFLDISRH